jgi:hypothetical protein
MQQKDWLKNILRPNNMAHIKEPEGIDFIIQSSPLTDVERKEISEFIKKRKEILSHQGATKKRTKKEATAD